MGDMHRLGHYGAAFLSYAPLAFLLAWLGYIELTVLGTLLVSALAMFPDYNQRLPYLRSRELTHTVWFALLVGLALAFLSGLLSATRSGLAIAAFVMGGFLLGAATTCSHLVADALTPAGVQPFAPFTTHTYSANVRANDPVVNYLLFVLGLGTLGVAVAVGRFL